MEEKTKKKTHVEEKRFKKGNLPSGDEDLA